MAHRPNTRTAHWWRNWPLSTASGGVAIAGCVLLYGGYKFFVRKHAALLTKITHNMRRHLYWGRVKSARSRRRRRRSSATATLGVGEKAIIFPR